MTALGIGFPSMFPDVTGDQLLGWAQRADEAGFCSLSSGERVAFGNHDLLMTMAAAGAVTRRIRLMTTVLAAPLHNATMLAKQAASLDRMTGGRFVLGVGMSERPDDFAAAGLPYAGRGRVFEQQLRQIRRIWNGDEPAPGVPPVGPKPTTPGGPQLLVGAFAPKALERAGQLADGLISFQFTPEPSVQHKSYRRVHEAWVAAGRSGRPYWVAGTYFALGPDAPAKAEQWLRHYYGYLPKATQDWFVRSVTTTSPSAIRETIEGFADAGADEIYFSPMIPDLDQVDRLADLL